jgi:heme o synthase
LRSFATSNASKKDESSSDQGDESLAPPPNEDAETKSPASSSSGSSSSLILLYASLAKARLSALVVSTTAAGYLAAGPHLFEPYSFTACLIGTALCSSSAAAYNQIFEINRDAKMKRTIHRPLVTGQLSISHAVIGATTWGLAGPTLLYSACGPAVAVLGVTNIILYAGIYTALKPISVTNTWVGAVVGAIPPVMGYAAAVATTSTDTTLLPVLSSLCLDPISVNLAALLYFWQLPHFMALSYMYRTDYARGGFAMLPCTDEVATANVMVRYSYYTATVPLLATLTGVTSTMFALEGLVLNGYAIAVAHQFRHERTNQNARKVFLTSLWYLPCTLMLFLLHSKTWDENYNKEREGASAVWMQQLTDQVQAIRRRGRELCLHETMAHDKASSCPIVVAEQQVVAAAAEAAVMETTATAAVSSAVVAAASTEDTMTNNVEN